MPLADLPGAIGPSAKGIQPSVNSERTSNLIVESVETNGKAPYYFLRVPGYSAPIATVPTWSFLSINGSQVGASPYTFQVNGATTATFPVSVSVNGGGTIATDGSNNGIQAGIYINGRRFFIASAGTATSGTLWELTGNGPYTLVNRGAVGPLVGAYQLYSMAANIQGNQLGIASNNVTSIFNLTTNVLTSPVTTPEPLMQIDETDGYFLGLAASGNFYISAFQDGTTWNALDFVFEETPDLTQTFKVCQRRVWMFGSNHGEAYYDSGDNSFPFTRDSSVYIE